MQELLWRITFYKKMLCAPKTTSSRAKMHKRLRAPDLAAGNLFSTGTVQAG